MDRDAILKIIGYVITGLLLAGGGTVGIDHLSNNQNIIRDDISHNNNLVRQDVYETRKASKERLKRMEGKLNKCLHIEENVD